MVDPGRQAWRDQVREAAIDPELAIVDPHHHLFPVAPRPKLEPCLADEFVAEIADSGHRVVATVHVDAFSNYRADGPEALRTVGETEFVDAATRDLPPAAPRLAAGIVAHAELKLGAAVGDVLDAHAAASPRFRGVRRMALADPDLPHHLPGGDTRGMLATAAFRDGAREVARRGLSLDVAIAQSQCDDLADFARAVPVTLVVNHLATPLGIGRYADHAADAFAEWKRGLALLADVPHVVVKIGGLNMPFTGLGVPPDADRPWTSAAIAERQRDHVLTAIDLFGPARCMFESNFPVDRWYTSYAVLWNAFKRLTAGFAAGERAALFAGTAARVYRLSLPVREDLS